MAAALRRQASYIDIAAAPTAMSRQRSKGWTFYTRDVAALTEAMLHGSSPLGYRDFWPGVRALESISGRGLAFISWGRPPTEEPSEITDPLDVERERLNVIDNILAQMYSEGRERASSSGLFDVVGTLFDCLEKRRFRDINSLLERADVRRLAPEYLLALLRSTFVERATIPAWALFLDRAEAEFTARARTDIDELLQGLRGHR